MICRNCGTDIGDKRFCPQCGTPANAVAQQPQGSPTKVLVFGIIGLACSGLGILGLIFSIIGLVQGNRYRAQYGAISKQANIGRNLSIAGLIISILCIVLFVALIILIIANAPAIEQAVRQSSGVYRYSYSYSY